MNLSTILENKRNQVIGLIILFIVLTALTSPILPTAIDWHGAFRPAALELLHGKSPYNASGYIYPPWTALILLPFSVFPEPVGRAMLVFVYLGAIVYTLHKLGSHTWSTLLILLSPPVLHGLLNGNIDWLVMLGAVLPPWFGLFLLVIKPQIGIGMIMYIFIETWRQHKFIGVLRTFTPVTIAYALSLFIYGLWPLGFQNTVGFSWNASLWPLSIPVGLALLTMAIRTRNIKFSLAASPCLSPYVLLHSWIGAFIAIASHPFETAAAVIGMWIVVALRFFS
jgi:hypothetical protein